MAITFTLTERLAGYVAAAPAGGKVQVCYRELIGPDDPVHLGQRLENIHNSLFGKIPGLPLPSLIDHLLVVIRPNLECTAYINELKILATVKTTRAVQAGSQVYVGDISDVTSVELGVELPPDCGVVFVRSSGWKRSLFFDFGPVLPEIGPRKYPIEQALAQQALLLLGLVSGAPAGSQDGSTRLQSMKAGLQSLKQLLAERCESESKYQELLEQHPWMLGGMHSEITRHRAYDDRSIPDFTAERCYDHCHDIIELKQPFLKLFRRDGSFHSSFNDAWNQAERYLAFATEQRSYLREEKELRFDNPRCLLILGYQLEPLQLREIRKKESFGRATSIFTYDHVVETATHLVNLMSTARQRVVLGNTQASISSVVVETSLSTIELLEKGQLEMPCAEPGPGGSSTPPAAGG
jgi:Domain of unknown function (DUF4263)